MEPTRFHLVARTGHPSFLDLPWDTPLEAWETPRLVNVIRGISRHVVRFVEYDGALYALSQTNSGLYLVDPATAAATLVGVSNVDLHDGDITFDADDHLWVWTNNQLPGFYELDPASAYAIAVDTSPPDTCAGLAALGHSNILYAASARDVIR